MSRQNRRELERIEGEVPLVARRPAVERLLSTYTTQSRSFNGQTAPAGLMHVFAQTSRDLGVAANDSTSLFPIARRKVRMGHPAV